MKNIKRALLLVSMTFLLLSCKGTLPRRLIYDYLDHEGPITLWGRKVDISYTEDLPLKVNNLYEDINKMVKEEKVSSNTLHNKVSDLYSLSYDYNRASMEADLYAAMNATKEYFDFNNKVSNEYTDASFKMNEVEKTIVKSEKYRKNYLKTFRPDLKGEALDRFVQECMNPSKPEIIESQKAMNTLRSKYNSGEINSYEFFNEFIPLSNAFAKEKGYDNYLEYAYANNYGRAYTVNDISSFAQYTVDYMIPLKQTIQQQYSDRLASLNPTQKEVTDRLMRGFFGNNLKQFENYANHLRGAFLQNYNYMMNNGNYFLSDAPNNPLTAYSYGSSTFDQYLFFSRNYQTLDTFVHEFGHYSAGFQSSAYNYDILETQSQGNEMLFSYFLTSLSDIEETISNTYAEWEEINLINSVVSCTWVNEAETYFYTHEGMTEQEMLDKTNEIAGKYGLFDQYESFSDSYVGIVTPGNPGYYISYAVSAMASLSLYALAVDEGFYDAADSYQIIASVPGSYSFEDMIKEAGLYNPLTEQGYLSIVSALTK